MSRSNPAADNSARAIASARRKHVEPLGRHLADDANSQARPGERLSPHHRPWQAELFTDPTHLVLEQRAQRFDQRELQVVRKPADVVVALDVRGSGSAAGFDDIADRACPVPGTRPNRCRRGSREPVSSNARMNSRPMIFRFCSGSLTPSSARKELRRCVDDLELHAGRGDEVSLDLLTLALAQQTVIDEHTGQLIADRALHERGGDALSPRRRTTHRWPACRLPGRGWPRPVHR